MPPTTIVGPELAAGRTGTGDMLAMLARALRRHSAVGLPVKAAADALPVGVQEESTGDAPAQEAVVDEADPAQDAVDSGEDFVGDISARGALDGGADFVGTSCSPS